MKHEDYVELLEDVSMSRTWLAEILVAIGGLSPAKTERLREKLALLAVDVKTVVDAAQDHVQRALPAGRGPHLLVDPDDATIEALVNRKTKPPKYVYDDSELLDAVVARAADQRKVDPATGEVLERPEDAVTRVLQDVYGLTGKQARSTHLEKYGIAMKDYRSVQRPTKLEVVK